MAQAPSRTRRRSTGTDLALIAGFAALIAACAILPSLKMAGPVPITLQTFGVLLTGAVLGWRRGGLAVLLYLAVGAAGLPVFADGRSGFGVFAGPTVGYLVGFPLAAMLCGFIVERLPRRTIRSSVPAVCAAGLFSSALCIHTLGMAGLVWRADLTWAQAFDVDKVFWIGDVIKNVAMALVATAVHRAFPDILDRPAAADAVAADATPAADADAAAASRGPS
jgi:biotin transport system substrate-specific component